MGYKILKIASQKRNFSRASVRFSSFVLGLSVKLILENNLKLGKEISKVKLKKIIENDFLEKATGKSLRLIGMRPRSEKEIFDKLRNYLYKTIKGTEQKTEFDFSSVIKDISGKAIERLKEKGLIDDEAFATWWIEQRKEFRPRSKRELFVELSRKGVDRRLIEKKLLEIDYNETEAAIRLIEKKLKSFPEKMEKIDKKKKLVSFLLGKGFCYNEVIGLIDERLDKR